VAGEGVLALSAEPDFSLELDFSVLEEPPELEDSEEPDDPEPSELEEDEDDDSFEELDDDADFEPDRLSVL
jgi:hypothetical protein